MLVPLRFQGRASAIKQTTAQLHGCQRGRGRGDPPVNPTKMLHSVRCEQAVGNSMFHSRDWVTTKKYVTENKSHLTNRMTARSIEPWVLLQHIYLNACLMWISKCVTILTFVELQYFLQLKHRRTPQLKATDLTSDS